MAKKLLLAEDSLTIQKVFSLTFQKSDISLTTVDNGEDAVRLAGEISPDLVIADVTLSDMSGFEVAASLRGAEKTRSCPILILAGSLPPFDEEKFRQCGASAVLFKPFESQELIDRVEALLREDEVPAGVATEAAEGGTVEAWDFSDVLEEVEEEVGKPPTAAHAAESLLPEEAGSTARAEDARSLGEFDVSLEDIVRQEGGVDLPAFGEETEMREEAVPEEVVEGPTGEETEAAEEEPPLLDLQAEELGFDISPAGEEAILPVEEVGAGAADAGEMAEPVGEVAEEAGDVSAVVGEVAEARVVKGDAEPVLEPPAEPVPPVEVLLERMPDDVLETAPFVPADPYVAELTAAPEMPPVPEIPSMPEGLEAGEGAAPEEFLAPDDAGIREEFSGRVREILEKVAAETVEKVMWEMMDRLSGEIRQQIREAVEVVAWDVIPATAESLIREEIERIRGKAAD